MNINISNELIVVGSFFFFYSWFITFLFIRSGTFLKIIVFCLSLGLIMTLEHLNSIELTIISFFGALTAYFGGVMSLFYRLRNIFIDGYYWIKDISSFISYPFQLIASGIKQTIIFIISVFLHKTQPVGNKKSSQSRIQQGKRNNKNNGQNYEEQKQRAKESFREAREEAQKREDQDTRSFEEIVGVNTGYTKNDLKAAYKRSASKFHPDKYSHMSKNFRDEAEQEFKKIQQAYNSLKFTN